MKPTPQIRIIAGSLKGRRLASPDWPGLRPTSDRLRETLFNVLADTVVGARVLDGFAGTGAVGIEAISRGASHVTFLERDPRALDLIGENLTRCGVTGGYTILRAAMASAGLAGMPALFDVVFLDPPYAMAPDEAVEAVAGVVAPGGRLVIEHARRSTSPASVGGLALTRTLTCGDSALSFYRHEGPAAELA
ncbi:MAG: 16S rRNA (guanine(966)-N(2))-methyltransferase RsmD [Vicinamibacteria bacterium]|nr:16S rRNA (guanine(966)-N(2))-methyltransferase RsmD [Vicinamibacteria bacterium]